MKIIYGLIVVCLFALGAPVTTWAVENAPENIKVKDSDSFQKYVQTKEPATETKTTTPKIKELTRGKKFRLPNNKDVDFPGWATLSGDDKIKAAVYHDNAEIKKRGGAKKHLEFYDVAGKKMFEVPYAGGFSEHWQNNRLYAFFTSRVVDAGADAKNELRIYDLDGKLIKTISMEWVSYGFSKSGKYLAVLTPADGAMDFVSKPAELVLYAADEKEYWKEVYRVQLIANAEDNSLSFSPDDKYLLVKADGGGGALVDYNEAELKQKGKAKIFPPKAQTKDITYLFDLSDKMRLISKERK